MEEQTKELKDYLVAIKKRKTAIISIISVVFLLTVLIAFVLPSKYTSSSTILIEQQDIPPEMVMSTVTSYADQRIQTIQARVMTRTNLLKIIDKFNLYKDERQVETTEEIINRMQKDVSLNIISADIVDPRTGRPSTATIAFSLSYTGENPGQVQKVANELTSLYLNENLTNRTQQATDTANFFNAEIARLNKHIDGLENKMAIFKQDNENSLPELQSLNLQLLQRMESDQSQLDAKLDTLNERNTYLSGQLAMMNPGNTSVPGAADMLKQLEAQYAIARGKYSPEYPDVISLKKQIKELKGSNSANDVSILADELAKLRSELKVKQQKYTPEYPDVISLKEKVASLSTELEKARDDAKRNANANKLDVGVQSDNPAYLTIQTQVVGVESEIKSVTIQRKKLSRKIYDLESALHKAPMIERKFLLLKREYENALTRYQEMKAKQMQANVAKQLETESKGERFKLIDPAALPEDPVSPNRPAIIFLGFILSMGCGFGFAFVADAMSGTVRGNRGIESALGVLPLASIPYELNLEDISRKKRVRKRIVILFILIIIAALLFINFVISPLDVLWFRILRQIAVLTA